MAYEVTHIDDVEEAQATFRFELLENGGTPATDELGLKSGTVLNWAYDDLSYERGVPVGLMPSVLELPLRDVSAALRATLKTGTEETFRLRVKQGEVTWWTGQVLIDVSRASLDLYNHSAMLRAVCGLARLKGINYDDAGVPFADDARRRLSLVIVDLLALTGFQLSVKFVSNRYPYHPTTPVIGNPLAFIKVDRGRWTTYTTAGEASPSNAFDVLKEICYDHELQIYQYENAWHVIERSEKIEGTYVEYTFDWQGSFVSTQTVDPVRYAWTTLNEAKQTVIIKGGQIEDVPALKRTAVRYNHGPISGEFLKYPSFEGTSAWINDKEPREWTRLVTDGADPDDVFFRSDKSRSGSHGAAIRGRSLSLQEVDAGTNPVSYATRSLRFDGPTVAAGTSALLRVALNGYIDQEGSISFPSPAPRPVYWALNMGTKWLARGEDNTYTWAGSLTRNVLGSDDGVPLFEWTGEDIVIPVDAAGGATNLYIYNVVETQALGNGIGGFETGEDYTLVVHWDDLSFRIEPDGEEPGVEATIFQAVVENSDATTSAKEVQTRFGDGPTALQKGSYTHADDSLTGSWKIDSYGGGESPFEYDTGKTLTHGFMAAAMRLRQQSVPLEQLKATFKVADIGECGPRHVLEETNSGQRFEPVDITRRFGIGDRGRIEGTWLELRLDATWPNEELLHDEIQNRVLTSGNASARILGLRNKSLLNQIDALPFTKTTGSHLTDDNPHLVLNVEAISGNKFVGLKKGGLVHIVDRRGLGQTFYTARLRNDVAQDDNQLDIEDPDSPGVGIAFDFNLSPGSGVYAGEGELLGAIGFSELFFKTRFEADIVAYLDEDIVSGTVLNIDVDDGLGGGSLHKVFDGNPMILYPNRSDGTVGDPIPFSLRTDENAGSSNWLIDNGLGGSVSIPDALVGSPIKFNGSARGTEISQNSADVLLRAFEDDVVETFFANRGSTFTRVASLSTGTRIFVDQLPEAIPGGGKIRVFVPSDLPPPDGNERGVLGISIERTVVPGGADKNDTWIDVTATLSPLAVPVDSLVYYDFGEVVTRIVDNEGLIAVNTQEILNRISSRENQKSFYITTAYNGSFRTSFQINGLESGKVLKVGDEFQIERLADGTITRCRVRTDLTGSGGAQTLNIDGTNVYSDSGSPCFLGSLAQTRLTLDGMIIDVQKMASGNNNTTVSGGLITSPGTAGWVWTEGGHFQIARDANNYILYNASGLVIRLGTGSSGHIEVDDNDGIVFHVDPSATVDNSTTLVWVDEESPATVFARMQYDPSSQEFTISHLDGAGSGSLRMTPTRVEVGGSGRDMDFVVNNDTLFVDVSEERVGIKKFAPTVPLHVGGSAIIEGNHRVEGYLEMSPESSISSPSANWMRLVNIGGVAYIKFSNGDLKQIAFVP